MTAERSCKTAFAAFVMLAAGVNIVLCFWFDRWHAGLSDRRNPHFRRTWVEHVYGASPKQDGEKLIVIIGNSQGYGREIEDGRTYAALLERSLSSKSGATVRVLNWSIPGGAGPEFVLLAAAAIRVRPDAVVLVSSPGNYARMRSDPGSGGSGCARWASDAHFLLAFHDVRRYIPEPFIRRFTSCATRAEAWIGRFFRLWRYRDLPASWVSFHGWFSLPENRLRAGRWTWFFRNSETRRGRRLPPAGGLDLASLDFFLEALSGTRFRKVFVLMPVHSAARGRYPDFAGEVRSRFDEAGGELWDLSSTVSDGHFLSVSHMNEQGHIRMAHLLEERLTS